MKNRILQKFINLIYRHPKGRIKDIMHLGGPIVYLKMLYGMKQMREYSHLLKIEPPVPLNEDSPSISFLTGHQFWFQTIFCIYSLQKVSPIAFRFHIYDDGSIDDQLEIEIKRQVPGVIVHRKREIDLRLAELFPVEKYPYLNHKRSVYPHIKKLIDIHVGNKGYNLVADSDMLFFKKPEFLLKWMQSPQQPFYILDKFNSYGFELDHINLVLNGSIPERVNVGLVALKSEDINWDLIESWAIQLETGSYNSYYLEQTLTAMKLSGENALVAPQDEYIVMPSHKEVTESSGTLHHYVDTSKPDYFILAWKKIL